VRIPGSRRGLVAMRDFWKSHKSDSLVVHELSPTHCTRSWYAAYSMILY
jgi:hypothetical protein